MMRRRRPESATADDIVRAIRENADALREEARKVELSHRQMDEIAARMDALAVQAAGIRDANEGNE